jgi:hypothetical protein
MAFKDYISKQGSTTELLATTSADGLLSASDKIKLNSILSGCPYKVGDILLSTSGTNPSGQFPGTTWSAWGSGRVPLGMGSNGTTNYTSVESTGGEEKHKLTVAEMPSHTHPVPINWSHAGNAGSDRATPSGPNTVFDTQASGGDGAHNNMQPYITCFMWKRTG